MSGMLASFCGVLLLSLGAGCSKRTPAVPQQLLGSAAAIDKHGIRIDGALITLPCGEARVREVLGPPDREIQSAGDGGEQLENRILVWDERGLYAYAHVNNGPVHAVAFSFKCEESTFCPKTPFADNLQIGGLTILAGFFVERALWESGFAPEYLPFWSKRLGHYHIFITPDESHNKIIDIQVSAANE